MLSLQPDSDDDPAFVAMVNAIVHGIRLRHTPHELMVVKIDNWFGPKWLKFSGKVLGALGTWKEEITIPPFTPNRVRWQRSIDVEGNWDERGGHPLHVRISGEPATRRRMRRIAPKSGGLWFSGGTATNHRGAIMAYVPAEDDYWTWYTGWRGGEPWQLITANHISKIVLTDLIEASKFEPAKIV